MSDGPGLPVRPGQRNAFVAPIGDQEALLGWLQEKIEKNKYRLPELQMKINLAFVLGHQWVVWDDTRRLLRRPEQRPADPNAPIRVTVNKMGSIVERTIAKLTKSVPAPECRPVTDGEDDVDAAKVSTRILDSELNRMHWNSRIVDFYFWVTTLGWSYVHVRWDKDAGNGIQDPFDVQETLEQPAGPLFEGEIELAWCPAFELIVDPNAMDFDSAKWVIRTVTMTKEAAWEQYGKVPDGAEPARTMVDDVYSLTADQRMRKRSYADFVPVHQFWMVPCRAAPAGLVVTWSGQTILEEPKPFPYNHQRLPFVQFDFLPGLGGPQGRTWVTDLVAMQTDYNDARSREATIRRTLVPKILAPMGSIDPNRITSRVEVITYNPVGQPPSLQIPDGRWMAQYETAMTRADSEMGERAGQSESTRGAAPSSAPAAAILALQEADDTKLAVSAKLMADGIERVGWQILQLARQFWSEERVVRTWSEKGELEVDHFTGADIREQLDIRVNTESALPRSKSARAQLALELRQQGLLQDPRAFVRMLDIPGTDYIIDSLDRDAKQAGRENDKLAHGQAIPINHFDNHYVHVQEHQDFQKSEDYERLPEEIRAIFDAHVMAHMEVLMPQMSVPTPPGTPQVTGPGAPGGGPGMYMDPMTGKPTDPLQAAAGNAPSALSMGPASIRRSAEMGGPGQPGNVPGQTADSQAAHMGR